MFEHHYLKTVCFLIFDPNFRYRYQIWGQNKYYHVENFEKIQTRGIRILSFIGAREEAKNLHKESKIYKLKQITTKDNCRFVYEQTQKNLSKDLNNYFTVKNDQHQYNTS